jgi:DNA-binding transcriptional LysR family regulator
LLDNLEVDAGLTYVDNEPLGRVRSVPLYFEHYRLLIAADHVLGSRENVSWKEVGGIPLCLLTPDMQNRRIIDRRLSEAGVEPAPTLQSNSMVVLFSHVRTGQWASVMPAVLAETMGLGEPIRAIPISDPVPPPTVGLVYPRREPMTPLTAALVGEALRVGKVWMG